MYEVEHTALDKGIKLGSQIRDLEKRINELDALKAEREQVKRAIDAAPTAEQVQQLEAKAREADVKYDKAMAAVKDAQLEARRAEEQLPAAASPGEKGLTPSNGNAAAASDKELDALQKSVEAAAAKATAAKAAASEEADAKRKMLDQAIELFQQTAAGLAKENPELGRYVQAVQQLQEKTHKLSGDLIEVQQQSHNRLSEMKKDLEDKVQARRVKLWAEDKQLADLRSLNDLSQRGYNAIKDQG